MDILFWSGGKDAYLALEFYRRTTSSDSLKLLTSYRESDEKVPHQNIEIDHIKEQAKHLDLELIAVPLPDQCPNDQYLSKINEFLSKEDSVDHLIFGDWHLQDIRQWREDSFGSMGYDCLFPIWKKSINKLLPVLILKPVEITISAVKKEYEKYIAVGETYDQRFVRQLPEEIDPLGENGEFHTKLTFSSLEDLKPGKQPLY